MTNTNIGSLQDAKNKMKDSFNQFVDLISKFLSIADYYSEIKNYYQPLSNQMVNEYARYYTLLSSASTEDFCYEIEKECLLYLDFIDEIRENLNLYFEIINDKQDSSLSEYDKTYDALTVRDEFIDLMKPINEAYNYIYKQKKAEPHHDNPKYDPVVKALQERNK